jgi:hypothetical protein
MRPYLVMLIARQKGRSKIMEMPYLCGRGDLAWNAYVIRDSPFAGLRAPIMCRVVA